VLDWPALEELDELDEQAARPRPAARARAAMPPGCTALIDVSFDTDLKKGDCGHGLKLSYSERVRVPRDRPWSLAGRGRPGGKPCPGRG